MIGDDSGPLHLAAALGKPSVGSYWVGNLISAGTLYREQHIPVVSWTTSCPVCGRSSIVGNLPELNQERCSHNPSFIADIPASDGHHRSRTPAGTGIPGGRKGGA